MGRVGAPLVRRDVEASLLAAALERAADGPGLVLLTGEAGIGKTRLLDETAETAGSLGWRVLTGGCLRLTSAGLAYGPWTEVLRGLARAAGGRAALLALAGDDAPALAPLLPFPSDAGAPPTAHVLEALLALVERLAAQRPLLLGLEDLHWADTASLDALAFLVRNLGPVPVLLLATTRTDEVSEAPARLLLAELRRAPRTQVVDLSPLDAEGTAALAVALGADPATVRDLHARTGGNPYYVTEVVAAGARPVRHLDEVVLARLDGLPPAARTVLEALAVAGRPTGQALLSRVTGLSDELTAQALRALSDRRLLGTAPAGHTPAHALAAEAVLGHLLPGARAALHTAYADALEADPGLLGDPAALALTVAEHRVGGGDDAAALRASVAVVLCGRTPGTALLWGQRALQLWESVPQATSLAGCTRGHLLALTAEAALRAGDSRAAVALARRSLTEPDAVDPQVAGRREERLAHYLWKLGDTDGAAQADQRALALLDGEPSPALSRARASYASTLMVLGQWEPAAAVCQEAIAAAERGGHDAELAHLVGTLGVVRASQGLADEGSAVLERAVGLARATGDPVLLWRTLLNAAYVAELVGRLEPAAALALEALALARRHALGAPAERAGVLNAVSPLFELGRWDEVDALAAEAPPTAEDDPRGHTLGRLLARLDVARGRPVDDALLHGDETEPQVRHQRLLLVAEHALWGGRPLVALDAVQDGLGRAGGVASDRARLGCLGLRAVADRLELPAGAGGPTPPQRAQLVAAVDGLLREQSPEGSPECRALALQADAEARRSRGEDDPAPWTAVALAWEQRAAPYPAATARWREAAAAAALRQPGADELLRRAHREAGRLGAAPLRRELEQLALRTRTALVDAPPERAPGPLDGLSLTAREGQVLQLLATGLSNRQLARRLHVTESTAGVHVSNVLRKLGVANRTEATAVAHRLGLALVEGGDA